MQNNYTSILNFREQINKIEAILQEEIRKNVKLIGISIQLMEEEQEKKTLTRQQKNINDFCNNIQQVDNCEKCTLFDIQAKEFIHTINNSQKGILLNCHAGVTNLLMPFKPQKENYKYKGPIFYIFLGHFLCNKEITNHFCEKYKFEVIDKNDYRLSDFPSNLLNHYNYYETVPDSFKIESGQKEIATCDPANLMEALQICQARLTDLLQKEGIIQVNDIKRVINSSDDLNSYVNRTEIIIIKRNLDCSTKSIESSSLLTREKKLRYKNAIDILYIKVNKAEDIINKTIESTGKNSNKNELINYLNSDSSEAKADLEKIDSVYKNFSLESIQKFSESFNNGRIGRTIWDNAINQIEKSKNKDDFQDFNFKAYKGQKKRNKFFSYLLNVDPKWYEYTAVLLFSVAGNFLYNIVNEVISSNHIQSWIWLPFGLFTISGFGVFYFSHKLHLSNLDYNNEPNSLLSKNNNNAIINKSEYVYNRLKRSYKLCLFIPMLLLLIFLGWFFVKQLNYNYDESLDDKLPKTSQVQINEYEIYASKKGHLNSQFKLVNDLIDSLNSKTILDAACGSGFLVRKLKDSRDNINIFGSDGSQDFLDNAQKINNLKIGSDIYLAKWEKIDRELPKLSNKVDLLLILGNSIPQLENVEDFSSVLCNFRKLLSQKGSIIFDIDTQLLKETKDKLICDTLLPDNGQISFYQDIVKKGNRQELIISTYKNKLESYKMIFATKLLNINHLVDVSKQCGFSVKKIKYNYYPYTLLILNKK
jgi:2-polyprenyl-3-methyl-5-hydroxy-6-metoxy-1,4-benzoquinol methylase